MTPLCLSAKAPKQNTFAIDVSSSSSPIRFGIAVPCITGGWGRWIVTACSGGLVKWWLASPTGCTVADFIGFGVVLLIPCWGHLICPLAVAGLALRYLFMSFSLRFGHSSRKTLQTALRRVDIFELHNNWCANLTAFAIVLKECVKLATCGTSSCASDGTVMFFLGGRMTSRNDGDFVGFTMDFVSCLLPALIGSVHRSVDGSFLPVKITFPLYHTSHFF